MSNKPAPPPPEVAALAERVLNGPVTVELTDIEFIAYVCALRNHWRKANTAQMDDWKARARVVDALHDVRRSLYADSVDTAHLRACWESRKIAETWDETYSLVLEGPSGQAAVLALAEYAELDIRALRELHAAAAAVLDRIATEVSAR